MVVAMTTTAKHGRLSVEWSPRGRDIDNSVESVPWSAVVVRIGEVFFALLRAKFRDQPDEPTHPDPDLGTLGGYAGASPKRHPAPGASANLRSTP